MVEVDPRKVALVLGPLHDFMAAARAEPLDAVAAAAEQVEIEEMVRHPHGAEKALYEAALAFLRHVEKERGGQGGPGILSTLGQALADEE
ncbi:MAG: hypothetical protein KIT20_06880 [Alphaproteobacteria bacterium]|nr:hypothetical protein [Alphaproteobacteria bacterium]